MMTNMPTDAQNCQTGMQPIDASADPYVLILRRHLEIGDVTRLLRYVSDFGRGDAWGHRHGGRLRTSPKIGQ